MVQSSECLETLKDMEALKASKNPSVRADLEDFNAIKAL